MSATEKKSNFREDFPGYQGHIPYKYSIIGKTVGSTNETIKELLSTEPPKETSLKPGECTDFSHYNRDYYCDNFDRNYPLEEDKIYSNKSKDAQTWIAGDKYKIYPQHIPNVQCHVPGIYSSNIYGLGYSKSTAVSIKGDYNKEQNCTNEERFKSTNQTIYKKPKTKSIEEEKALLKTGATFFNPHDPNNQRNYSLDRINRIYHSKIAKVPTVGYAGTQSIFQKQIGYLNYDKILEKERLSKLGPGRASYADLPQKFQEALKIVKYDDDLPYVVGYKGFRVGVKARNFHGENFHNVSLKARNEAKVIPVQ